MRILIFRGGGFDGCWWQWNCMVEVDGEWEKVYVSGWRGEDVLKAGPETYMKETPHYRPGKGLIWLLFDTDSEEDMEELMNTFNAQMIDTFLSTIMALGKQEEVLRNARCGCQSEYHDIKDHGTIKYLDLCISRDGRDFICEECWDKEGEECGS